MVEIRQMCLKDVEPVSELEAQIFSEPWSAKGFEDALAGDNALFLVAYEEERLAGYVGIYISFDEGEITNVAVNEHLRGHQIGTELIRTLVKELEEREVKTIILEVRQSNEAAKGLYHKMGFKDIGIRKKFYRFPSEDAIIMQKNI